MVARIFPLLGNSRKVIPHVSGSLKIGSHVFHFNGRTAQHGIGEMHDAEISKLFSIIAKSVSANEEWMNGTESLILQFSIYPSTSQDPKLNEGIGFEFNTIRAFRYFCTAWSEDNAA